MIRYVARLLKVARWIGILASGMLTLALLWSLVADLPVPGGFALEIGPMSFNVHQASPDPSHNLTILLPVSMDATRRDSVMPRIRGSYRFAVEKGVFLSASIALLDIFLVLSIYIADQLRRVFDSLEDKEPFQAENARRIRRIGWTVILLEVMRALATAYWSGWAVLDGWRAASNIGATGVLFGLIILALAQVFQEGARLREDQSLTI
jgi:hypothetical protein